MEITKLEVEEVLQSEDVEGLLELGAPGDEYSQEAKSIASAMVKLDTRELTEDRLTAVIRSVWERSFGPFSEVELERRSPALRQVAHRLLRVHV